jgi:hypothetical protein
VGIALPRRIQKEVRMAMSEEEKQAYLAEIDGPINDLVDQEFLKRFGKTYREPDDSTKDSWEKIKQDFPSLFGESEP